MAQLTLLREKPMAAAKFKRIVCGTPNAANQLAHLRSHLSTDGEVVSPRHKKLTLSVFGEALSPSQAVERICNDVRDRGLPAVLHYTEQFDKVKLKPQTMRVTAAELEAAHAAADPDFLDTIRRVRAEHPVVSDGPAAQPTPC